MTHPTPANANASAETLRQLLTFTIAGEEYGVDIMTVREIKGWAETTRLPNAADYMRGVMNLRGAILPIFDLRMRFCHQLTETTPKHVVIILAVGTRTIGLLVDAVSDILEVTTAQVQPPPDSGTLIEADYISGLIAHGDRMVVLLNAALLFDPNHIEQTFAESA